MSKLNGFLSDIRILDLTRHYPGPLATLLMSDMGAEVLKVEPPRGDELRAIGPQDETGRPLYFDAINAGKRVRTLDLKDEGGRREFLDLAGDAEVVVESFRPGVMERLGLAYQTLKGVNRGLVVCSMSGYGADGPLRDVAGHDANYLSLSGMLAGNGPEESPSFFDPPVADFSSSLFAVIAVLGALRERERSGEGCHIDLALADVAMPLQVFQLAALGVLGEVPRRQRNLLNGGAAYYRVYETGDARHLTLCAIEPKFWVSFCTAAGHEEWIARHDDAFPQSLLRAELSAFFAARDLDQCLDTFKDADCCLAPVLDLAEAVATPHHATRGLVRRQGKGAYQALFPALVDGEPPEPRQALVEEA